MTNEGSARDPDAVDHALLAVVRQDGRATLAELADGHHLRRRNDLVTIDLLWTITGLI